MISHDTYCIRLQHSEFRLLPWSCLILTEILQIDLCSVENRTTYVLFGLLWSDVNQYKFSSQLMSCIKTSFDNLWLTVMSRQYWAVWGEIVFEPCCLLWLSTICVILCEPVVQMTWPKHLSENKPCLVAQLSRFTGLIILVERRLLSSQNGFYSLLGKTQVSNWIIPGEPEETVMVCRTPEL